MKKLVLVLSIVGVLVGVLVTVVYFVKVRPWVVGPEETDEVVEERWARVEEWATTPPDCGATDAALLAAAATADEELRLVRTLAGDDDGSTLLDDEDLTHELRTALEQLVSWHERGTELGGPPCEHTREVLGLIHLGDAALSTIDGPSPRLDATLHLARSLRRCGSFIESAVGFALARNAVEWARSNGQRPTESFIRYRPTNDEMFFALAREAVCVYEVVEEGIGELAQNSRIQRGPVFSRVMFNPARELQMVRAHRARLVVASHESGRDPHGMGDLYDFDDVEELPHSLMVRTVALGGSGVHDMANTLEAYDAFLAGEEPPSPRH